MKLITIVASPCADMPFLLQAFALMDRTNTQRRRCPQPRFVVSFAPLTRKYLGRRRNFTGQQFWARGYHVSTVGRDEKTVREYIRSREKEDRRIDQLSLFK